MADSYSGPVRILDGDGILLTTGAASLVSDPEAANWRGALATLRGTAVAGKALVVEIEIPGGERGRAQLTPSGEAGERYTSDVTGLSRQPF